jgi:hypothetical protein
MDAPQASNKLNVLSPLLAVAILGHDQSLLAKTAGDHPELETGAAHCLHFASTARDAAPEDKKHSWGIPLS